MLGRSKPGTRAQHRTLYFYSGHPLFVLHFFLFSIHCNPSFSRSWQVSWRQIPLASFSVFSIFSLDFSWELVIHSRLINNFISKSFQIFLSSFPYSAKPGIRPGFPGGSSLSIFPSPSSQGPNLPLLVFVICSPFTTAWTCHCFTVTSTILRDFSQDLKFCGREGFSIWSRLVVLFFKIIIWVAQ